MVHLDDLLAKTSRSSAMTIPLLAEPTRKAVSLIYLLLRVADSFADATEWNSPQREAALQAFGRLLALEGSRRYGAARALALTWARQPPQVHAGITELLEKTPEVLAELDSLAAPVRATMTRNLARLAQGLAEWGGRSVADLKELQAYCAMAAGTVVELLTEVFLHDAPSLGAVEAELRGATKGFAEGLQLLNVLRGVAVGAREGRSLLPPGVDRAEVVALARRGLDQGEAYVRVLQQGGAPGGVVGFTGLSLMLARATLDRVEAEGPGAKVPRSEVARLFSGLMQELAAGRPVTFGAVVGSS